MKCGILILIKRCVTKFEKKKRVKPEKDRLETGYIKYIYSNTNYITHIYSESEQYSL